MRYFVELAASGLHRANRAKRQQYATSDAVIVEDCFLDDEEPLPTMVVSKLLCDTADSNDSDVLPF